MRVCFICRGYPGLGKVVGAIAIDAMLRAAFVDTYQSLFLTYYKGYEFLKSTTLAAIDLLAGNLHIGQSAFCTPFGLETRTCVERITEFQPDLVFNDGEPYLIEVTSDILRLPTIVLAHPADLYSASNSTLAIDLFRYYYSKANLVIAHGLDRLPMERTWLGGKAGQAIETNTIIRDEIYQQTLKPQPLRSLGSCHVVGVLGGGSQNVSPLFREGTQTLSEWIIRACNDLSVQQATLYCADDTIYTALQTIPSPRTHRTLIAKPSDNVADIVRADVVVARAGRNLVSELIALGKSGLVVPVSAEKFRGGNQVATAESAVRLNPNLRLARLEDGYGQFRDSLQAAIATPPQPTYWQPGNGDALAAIQRYLDQQFDT